MPTEEIPTYYCKRIKSNVAAERAEDVTGKVYVQCKEYTGTNNNPCNKDFPKFRKCLVKLMVQREVEAKLSS